MSHRRDTGRREPGRHRQDDGGCIAAVVAVLLALAIVVVLALYLAI